MKLLFIDTETTGLKPQDGQIIEITGIIVEFNPNTFDFILLDTFDSTVALRSKMDDKITRITGITELELSTAPDWNVTRENWLNWLEPYSADILAVVGHSIDFDLGFLKYEKWFLPEEYKIVDTLHLCKIYLPNYSAINLEFLVEKLSLDTALKQEFDDTKQLTAHRSHYDTRVCVELFTYLIRRIDTLGLSGKLQQYISSRFLPLPLIFYPKSSDFNETIFQDLLDVNLPEAHSLILSQKLVMWILNSTQDFTFPLKFHSQGKSSLAFGGIVDTILQDLQQSTNSDLNLENNKKINTVPRFESIIGRINFVLEKTVNVSKIVEYVDWLWQIHESNSNHPAVLSAQKLLSSYDFFIFSMQNVWQKSEYYYEPATMRAVDRPIYDKFTQISQFLGELSQFIAEPFTDVFSQYLANKISELLLDVNLIADLNYTFRHFKNNFTVSQARRGYTVANHLEEQILQFDHTIVETFLSPSDFKLLLGWLSVSVLFEKYKDKLEIKYQTGQYTVADEFPSLDEFFAKKLDESRLVGRPTLILCGQNSTLKDSQKVLTENFGVKDYLALGESGSITKIGSKLVRGFDGLLVTKLSDFYYFQYLPEVPEFYEIWLINPPYLWVHKSLSNVDFTELKKVYLNGQLNFIANKSDKTVFFLKSYK